MENVNVLELLGARRASKQERNGETHISSREYHKILQDSDPISVWKYF
jgi:hypothetical protein